MKEYSSPTEGLDSIGLREILDHDLRPTFVVDLDNDEHKTLSINSITSVFCNHALKLHESLLVTVTESGVDVSSLSDDKVPSAEFRDFKRWATSFTAHNNSEHVTPLSFSYSSMLWTGSTLRKRWRLISGTSPLPNVGAPAKVSSESSIDGAPGQTFLDAIRDGHGIMAQLARNQLPMPKASSSSTYPNGTKALEKSLQSISLDHTRNGHSESIDFDTVAWTALQLAPSERTVSDWTVQNPRGLLTPHHVYARSIDWATTPLGAMGTWSPELRQMANLVMQNPHPASLFWGAELTALYNEAYAKEIAGSKHPSLMGTGFSGPFPEQWEDILPNFIESARTGVSLRKENDCLPVERHGYVEETFFSWSWTPVYCGTDKIQGFYNAPFETSQQQRNRRGMKTILRVGERTGHAKTVKDFWKATLDGLEENPFEAPFAMLYSIVDVDGDEQTTRSPSAGMSTRNCCLEGTLGIPVGHPAAPANLDLQKGTDGFVPYLREAMRTREPTLLNTQDGTLSRALLDGIEWRGYGDACREAMIVPLRPTNSDAVLALLVLGINPRRPYDDEYRAFTSMLNRQLATSMASIILLEEETRKNRDAAEAAASEQEKLSQELALQTGRLRRMTEMSPLGMFLISPDGVSREVNDRFVEMTGVARDSLIGMEWTDFILPSHSQKILEAWEYMIREHTPWSGELQLKDRDTGGPVDFNGSPIDYWVLFTAQPEFASDGSLRSIMGSITDISQLKWAQRVQEQRLVEAEERRRQQNDFIDITSHEMRNPLSAILQCADDISDILETALHTSTAPSQELVESCLDSAKTITLCVQHQKSIVDDILTVSKLASNLLTITPAPAQPVAVVKHALKMLDPELQAKDIKVEFVQHESLVEHDVAWMEFDASRVLQIMINLITNAIKFTSSSQKREITITVGASREQPLEIDTAGFDYVPVRAEASEEAPAGVEVKEETLFLRFFIKDSGCGLTKDEKTKLFERFSQASPRTHAVYGGSGLGLFISRQLAELLGGRIGVASKAGKGSTFGFFIAAVPAPPPPPSPTLAAGPPTIEPIVPTTRLPVQRLRSSSLVPTGDVIEAQTAPAFHPADLSILVVEDNIINQKVLVKQIQQVGSAVVAANDGIEALDHLEKTHYRISDGGLPLSIVLMDLEMPNMDGLTCVRTIRQMERDNKIRGRVPVIAVTANVRDEQVAAAMTAGMDDVVGKPFRIVELYKKVEALLKATSHAKPAN